MPEEARLESVASGLAPVAPGGWFVVNAGDAAWVNNDQHGGVCIFESDEFVLRGRPDLQEYVKPGAGFVIRVVSPGQPTGGFHAESVEEDFLVRRRRVHPARRGRGAAPAHMGLRALPARHRPHVRGRRRRPVRDRLLGEPGLRRGDVLARVPLLGARAAIRGQRGPGAAAPGTWKVERPPQWPDLPWS